MYMVFFEIVCPWIYVNEYVYQVISVVCMPLPTLMFYQGANLFLITFLQCLFYVKPRNQQQSCRAWALTLLSSALVCSAVFIALSILKRSARYALCTLLRWLILVVCRRARQIFLICARLPKFFARDEFNQSQQYRCVYTSFHVNIHLNYGNAVHARLRRIVSAQTRLYSGYDATMLYDW